MLSFKNHLISMMHLWMMQALVALVKVWHNLCKDAVEAAEQPLEFSLLVCVLTTVVDGIVALTTSAIRRCCSCGGCCAHCARCVVENVVPGGVVCVHAPRSRSVVVWWVGLGGLVRFFLINPSVCTPEPVLANYQDRRYHVTRRPHVFADACSGST